MKLEAEVLSVETIGDKLAVRTQADETATADWRPMVKIDFQVADTPRNRKTMHVGRRLAIKIEPR